MTPRRALRLRPWVRQAALLLSALLLFPHALNADDDLEQAMAAMRVAAGMAEGPDRNAKYEEALAALDRLRARAGDQPQIELLRGTCMNRIPGRQAEAFAVLDAALSRAPDSAPLLLESGIGAFHLKDYDTSIDRIDRALAGGLPPEAEGDARTFLGAALAGKGERARAREELARAEAILDRDSPAYRTARDWRRQLEQHMLIPEDRRWTANLTLGLGGVGNAVGLNEDEVLPGGVSNRSSPYWSLRGFAWVDLVRGPRGKIRLSYFPDLRRYTRARSLSSTSHTAELLGIHDMTERWRLEGRLRVIGDWLLLPTRAYRSVVETTGVLQYSASPRAQTRFSLSLGFHDYHLGGLSGTRNPDSLRIRPGVEQVVLLDEAGRAAIFITAGITANDARGRDWRYTSVDGGAALLLRPTDRLSWTVGIYAASTRYHHVDSVFGRRRRDAVIVPYSQLTVRLNAWLGVTVSAAHTSSRSTLRAFDYRNWDLLVGPAFDFYALIHREDTTP